MRVDDRDAVLNVFTSFRPELVLHGGAFTAVDRCETEADAAFAVNAIGTRNVAEAAALVGAHMVYVSTDYVFDGTATRPYREWDTPCPTSVVRRIQAGWGARVPPWLDHCAHELAVWRARGQHGRDRAAAGGRRRRACVSSTTSTGRPRSPPTWRPPSSPSASTVGLASSTSTNSGTTTWWGFVRAVLAEAGADPERVKAISTAEYPLPAPRPAYSVLDNMALRLSGLPRPARLARRPGPTGAGTAVARGGGMTLRSNAAVARPPAPRRGHRRGLRRPSDGRHVARTSGTRSFWPSATRDVSRPCAAGACPSSRQDSTTWSPRAWPTGRLSFTAVGGRGGQGRRVRLPLCAHAAERGRIR